MGNIKNSQEKKLKKINEKFMYESCVDDRIRELAGKFVLIEFLIKPPSANRDSFELTALCEEFEGEARGHSDEEHHIAQVSFGISKGDILASQTRLRYVKQRLNELFDRIRSGWIDADDVVSIEEYLHHALNPLCSEYRTEEEDYECGYCSKHCPLFLDQKNNKRCCEKLAVKMTQEDTDAELSALHFLANGQKTNQA